MTIPDEVLKRRLGEPLRITGRRYPIMGLKSAFFYEKEVKLMGFFDKLKEQASVLGAQLDQALDVTKQKTQIGSLRKKRQELVTQLGEHLLYQFRENRVNPEELRGLADQIFDLERQIIELEKQVQAQKQATAQAPTAAASPPPPGPGQVASPPPPPAMESAPAAPGETVATGPHVCPSCGVEAPADSAFCPNCGGKLGG